MTKKFHTLILALVLVLNFSGVLLLMPQKAEAALARTQRLVERTDSNAALATGYTTASFTPSNNSLLVVALDALFGDGGDPHTNLTLSGGGLTWTKRVSAVNQAGFQATQIWTAPVTTGSSMAITIAGGVTDDSFDAVSFHVYDYTGYDTASPIGATATQSGVDSITLSGAPVATSEVLAAFGGENTGSIAPGGTGGFSELNESLGGSGLAELQTQSRTGSVSTTVDWTIGGGGCGSGCFGAVAVEIKAAATDAVPGAPSNLVATPSGSSIILNWTEPSPGTSGITAYNIYRDTSSPATTLLFSQTSGTSSETYTDTAATGGMPFFYRVSATNDTGESGYSNEVNGLGTTGRIIRLKGGVKLRGGVRLR